MIFDVVLCYFFSDDFEAEDVVVNKDDFLHSMNRLKPSVKPDDLKYFESLQSKFS